MFNGLEKELERRLEKVYFVTCMTISRDEHAGEYTIYYILDSKVCGYKYSYLIYDVPPLVALYEEVGRIKKSQVHYV